MNPSPPLNPIPPVLLIAAACFALTAPTLLAFNAPPSSTFLNQALALVGWGGLLAVLAASMRGTAWPRSAGLAALQGALAVLILAALATPVWAHAPWSMALSSAGMVLAAVLAAQAGAAAQNAGIGPLVFRAFCIGMVVAGVASSVIGILQVFTPNLTDGEWIARTYLEGRAVGNLRQPNHLGSLLLWAIVAAVWLGDTGVIRRWASTGLVLLFVFVVILSGSRTSALSLFFLLGWGVLDSRLSKHSRWLLGLAPLAGLLFWFGMAAWADLGHGVFGAEGRFSGKGDISSSRFGIWRNTVELIRMHPWSGVGFGELNFAWSLTPFPGRPGAFFDHTHNIVLQFAVELGLPLAALVLGLLIAALVLALVIAVKVAPDPAQPGSPLQRAAFMVVFLILIHSLLEYPLWYAYFLLPAAFAFGLGLVKPPDAARASLTERQGNLPLLVAACVLMLVGAGSVIDYWRVVLIFEPGGVTTSLAQRIADGRRSIFFAHHAEYAAATTTDHPVQAIGAFLRAPHYLLDARLLQAWATAMDDAGYPEHARYLAQRLREFRNPQSAEFFEPCDSSPADKAGAGEAKPFQCQQPSRAFTYEDFR